MNLRLQETFDLLKSAIRGEEQDYTKGSIRKAVFLLSIPMVLELGMESVFAIVDTFFVSRISTAAIATVGFTESVMMIIYSLAWGLSMGVTAVVARRTGEKDAKGAGVAAGQGILIALMLSVVIGIPGVIWASDVLELMGAEAEVVSSGWKYTAWLLGGNVVIMLLFVINAIFRGVGDPALAMRSLGLANLCNIILDPLLIFGFGPVPAMGIEGAAIATTIGRGIGVVYQLAQLSNVRGRIRLDLRTLRPVWDITLRIIKISFGSVAQFIVASASMVFLVRIVSTFGSNAVAGYTVAFRIIIFSLLPSWGVANAAATLVGQNLGAKEPDRAERSAWLCGHYNMVFMVIVAILFWVFAPTLIGIFSAEPEVIQVGVDALRIICVGYLLYGYGMVLAQAFNGAGDTSTPLWMNILCFWCIEIPLAWLLAMKMGFGPSGVFAAVAVAESSLAIVSAYMFNKGKWKLAEV